MRFIILTLIIAAFGLLIIGCGSSTPTVSSSAPAWVNKSGGFYEGDRGKAFYGVGASTGLTNVQLRRTAAETNARADLARMFQTRVQDLVKIYSAAIQAGPDNATSEEALTSQITRSLTDMELSGTTVIDHYFDPNTQTEFALAMLDAEGFKNSLDKVKQLNEQVKMQVKFNAQKGFEELDQQIEKNKQ